MTYNILADLAVFGLFLMGLGVSIWWFERKARRYAVTATPKQIRAHQRKREAYMLRHGGLPVDMRRAE